jgi:hypothetical protein
MCECHQSIKQCQPVVEKIKKKAIKEDGLAPTKYETLHLSQWTQKTFEWHEGMQSFPTMDTVKEMDPHGV